MSLIIKHLNDIANYNYTTNTLICVGMKPEMRLWREEVFGPVLAAMTFKTEEEAVQLANASEFGLAGAVISADEQVRKDRKRSMPSCIITGA